jgi:hypothetical protein
MVYRNAAGIKGAYGVGKPITLRATLDTDTIPLSAAPRGEGGEKWEGRRRPLL